MSLLEWLKFWSKFYSLPLFCRIPPPPPPPPPPQWKFSESPSLSTEYPPSGNWNLGRSWHFKTFQFSVSEYPPPPGNWNLGRSWHFKSFQFSVSEYPHPPMNENCHRVQIREFQNTPPKIGQTSDFKLQNSLKIWEILSGD